MAYRYGIRLLLAILALTGAAQIAAAQNVAAPIAAAQAPAVSAPRHYLWEVASLTNRVYLYGTVHAGKASFYPLPGPVRDALADSKVLAVEADISNAAEIDKDASSMFLTPPDTLAKHVSESVYLRFRRQIERLGMPEEQMARLKPFFAASLLALAQWHRQGYSPQLGVDAHLLAIAREQNLRIFELEGVRLQSALMNSVTEKEGLQALEGVVGALESGLTRDQITGTVDAWQSGDPKGLLDIMRAYNDRVPGARELEEKFVWSRHDEMTRKIERWLLDGRERVFVAVGALHLAGPRGLVEILRERGFVVKQL